MSPPQSQIDPAYVVLQRARPHLPLIATIAACATLVVASDSPGRLDLWMAEWFGTVVLLSVPPAILMRWFGMRDSIAMLFLPLVIALGLAQARSPSPTEADAASRAPQSHSKRLPTASDGFGAYTKLRDASRSS